MALRLSLVLLVTNLLLGIAPTQPVVTLYGDVSFTNLTGQEVRILSANNVSASLKDASGSDDVLNINLESLSADKGFNPVNWNYRQQITLKPSI
jgi:hypothetical protein